MTNHFECNMVRRFWVITYNLEDCVSQAVCSWSSQGQHVGEAKKGDNYHLPLRIKFCAFWILDDRSFERWSKSLNSDKVSKILQRFVSCLLVTFWLSAECYQGLGSLIVSPIVVQGGPRSKLGQHNHHDPHKEESVDHLKQMFILNDIVTGIEKSTSISKYHQSQHQEESVVHLQYIPHICHFLYTSKISGE